MWAIFKNLEYGFGGSSQYTVWARVRSTLTATDYNALAVQLFLSVRLNYFSGAKKNYELYSLDLNEVPQCFLTEWQPYTAILPYWKFLLFRTGALVSFEKCTNLPKIFQHPPLHLLGKTSSQGTQALSPRLSSLHFSTCSSCSSHNRARPSPTLFSSLHGSVHAVPSAGDSCTAYSFQLTMFIQESSQAASFFRKLSLSCLAPTWMRPLLCLPFLLIVRRTCHWFPISSAELLLCESRTFPRGQHRGQQWDAPCPSTLLRQLSHLVL